MPKQGESATTPNTDPSTSSNQGPSISKLKKIRGGYRGVVTKTVSEARSLLDDENPVILNYDKALAKLKEKHKQLTKINEDIFLLISEDEVEEEVIECENLNSEIQSLIVELESGKVALQNASTNVPTPVIPPTSSSVGVSQNSDGAKLPKLQLPRYFGDPKKWQEWWDSFQVIHENTTLSDVNKFRHLKSLLEGPAAAVISGIPASNANYFEAIDLLKNRFAQKQIIINAHMESLQNLKQVSSERDVKALRKLYDSIETNVRSLKSLGVDFTQYGVLLIPMLMTKIPEEIRLMITRLTKKDDWALDGFLKIFLQELEAREQCSLNSEISSGGSAQRAARSPMSTTAALLNNGGKITCTYCKGSHASVKCNVITEPLARKTILQRQGRCFVCLKRGHLSRDCSSHIHCFLCRQRHHASICQAPRITPGNTKQPIQGISMPGNSQSAVENPIQAPPLNTQRNPTEQVRRDIGQSTVSMFIDAKGSVLLQTAKGFISPVERPNENKIARMIFDSGSQRSYISQSLKDALSLPTIRQETLEITIFGSDVGTVKTCDVTQFCVRSPYNDLSMYVTAYVVPTVSAPLKNQAINFAASTYPHLSGLMLADYPADSGDELLLHILIGADYYWHFMNGGMIRGEQGGPVALDSKLGWILSGPVPNCPKRYTTQTNLAQTHLLQVSAEVQPESDADKLLKNELSRFWELEALGISSAEDSVYENFSNEIQFVGGRYEVKLPWKKDHPVLPDNYLLSKHRLERQFKKLQGSPELLSEYDAIIKEQEEMGIVERVKAVGECEMGKVHYLPHHPVIRADKLTTKVRVVYDASAASNSGVSLNSCLYPGPCLLKTVAEILARFRAYPIALTADIEKAFLMIAIHESDRDALRFLWYADVNARELDQITYHFCRVVFGVTCSPFLLNATLKHHIEKYASNFPEICSKLMSSLYVDDVSAGGNTVDETFEFYQQSKRIMKEGNFNLRKWHSSSSELSKKIASAEEKESRKSVENPQISEEDETFTSTTIGKNVLLANTTQKILGLNWDSKEDTIVYNLSALAKLHAGEPVTKRNVLSLIAKIFDPLGLITPITTMLKVFMQRLFEIKLDWDEPLPATLQSEWASLIMDLESIGNLSVPRYYFGDLQGKPDKIELFGFCDSSETAYAAVVYAKITSQGRTSVKLVMSKTRVTPLSRPTIPRLELLSCLILARLINAVKDALSPICEVEIAQCWTDSITAKYWIEGVNKEWKLFVENRVQEIRSLVSPQLWSHCPGKENPADIPTRRVNVLQFVKVTSWWDGPQWLHKTEQEWPKSPQREDIPDTCVDEMKAQTKSKKTAVLAATAANIQALIEYERFSSYEKLVKVVAYVLRFVRNCKNKENRIKGEISTAETSSAEKLVIRQVQSTFNQSKLEDINKNLGTFLDEDMIIRCKGRLQNSSLEYEAKCPILMPRDHYVTTLLIRRCHESVMHNGTKETLAELRSRFWVTKGRQVVKKVIRKCVMCKRIQGQSYEAPKASQLPEFRVKEKHAFSSVGIDFAGPLYVKSKSVQNKKVYLALFTCGVSRALHLELVPDLSTETFLRCFKRFVSRRGVPSLVVTDNAKTFKAASKRLLAIFKSQEIQTFLNAKSIKWHYNLSKAPWNGGFYERLIRGVKSCMKKCIGGARLSYDELHTVVTEIEAVLNSRPLTYLYADELEEALTPSHLLLGRRLLTLPEVSPDEEQDKDFDEREDVARRRERYLSRVLNHYWKRWKTEYLVDLREYHKLETKRNNVPEISEGDIVTIEDENRRNRSTWRLGKVEEVKRGQDNVIRGARIRLANGNCIDRPIQKLYPLEINQRRIDEEAENSQDTEMPAEEGRPQRKAAIIARERMDIIDQLEKDM